jgi:hypothetical protein
LWIKQLRLATELSSALTALAMSIAETRLPWSRCALHSVDPQMALSLGTAASCIGNVGSGADERAGGWGIALAARDPNLLRTHAIRVLVDAPILRPPSTSCSSLRSMTPMVSSRARQDARTSSCL